MTRNRSLSLLPLDTPFSRSLSIRMGGGGAFGLRLFDVDDADDAAGGVERGGNCSAGRGAGGGDRIWNPGSEGEACSDGGGGAVGINLSDGLGKVELQSQPFLCSEKKAKL